MIASNDRLKNIQPKIKFIKIFFLKGDRQFSKG